MSDDAIPVRSTEEYIELTARRIYDRCRPRYTATISTDGVTTGPTRLTWETEDEVTREWCRAFARDTVASMKRPMPTLKWHIDRYTWTDIEPRFKELYPDASVAGHAVAYEEIRFVVPKQDNEPLQIRVKEVQPDPKYHEEGGWFNVSGSKVDGDVAGYAIEFSPWSWWLAQELHEDTLKLPPIDIICHCLHEMTFCGYSQEEVAAKSADILGTAEAAKAELERMKNGEIPEGWSELTDEDFK